MDRRPARGPQGRSDDRHRSDAPHRLQPAAWSGVVAPGRAPAARRMVPVHVRRRRREWNTSVPRGRVTTDNRQRTTDNGPPTTDHRQPPTDHHPPPFPHPAPRLRRPPAAIVRLRSIARCLRAGAAARRTNGWSCAARFGRRTHPCTRAAFRCGCVRSPLHRAACRCGSPAPRKTDAARHYALAYPALRVACGALRWRQARSKRCGAALRPAARR